MKSAVIFICIAFTIVYGTPHFPGPYFHSLFCPEDLCMGCKEDGATDISAIVEIDCYETNEDCHEPLKHCVNCWDDPTTDICKKDCIVGPGPCINENKIKVGNCIEGKKLALARADKCLVCAEACGMDQNTPTTDSKMHNMNNHDEHEHDDEHKHDEEQK